MTSPSMGEMSVKRRSLATRSPPMKWSGETSTPATLMRSVTVVIRAPYVSRSQCIEGEAYPRPILPERGASWASPCAVGGWGGRACHYLRLRGQADGATSSCNCVVVAPAASAGRRTLTRAGRVARSFLALPPMSASFG